MELVTSYTLFQTYKTIEIIDFNIIPDLNDKWLKPGNVRIYPSNICLYCYAFKNQLHNSRVKINEKVKVYNISSFTFIPFP